MTGARMTGPTSKISPHTLSTYGGEPYGHSGQFEHLMHIGNTCIPALPEPGMNPRSH